MSVAVSVTASASTLPIVPSAFPSMNAMTWVVIRLSAREPAPVNPTPTAPPAIATDRDRTSASIVSLAVAVSVTSPEASTVDRRM